MSEGTMSGKVWTDAVEGIVLTKVDADYEVKHDGTDERFLKVSRVNVLVGANNAGKSRFMRSLIGKSPYADPLRLKSVDDLHWRGDYRRVGRNVAQHIEAVMQLSPLMSSQQEVQEYGLWRERLRQHLHALQLSLKEAHFEIPMARIIKEVVGVTQVINTAGITVPNTLKAAFSGGGLPELKRRIDHEVADGSVAAAGANYVPTLRGLRAVSRANGSLAYDDRYGDATRQDYSLDPSVRVETGLTLYEDLRKHLLGKRDERARVRAYEDFLSRSFFDNVPVTLTPHEDEQALHVDLGGVEHPIHHVGDGLQSVIVMTYRAFMTKDAPGLFFIEEPELFLHPGMQRRLLHFFLHETKHLYFLTTHSNHLLDLSMDERGVTVYNFHRGPKPGASEKGDAAMVTRVQRVNGGDRSSLALLGVRASSVFLVNATVWVEGITDRLYLREMLRLYVASQANAPGFRRMEEDAHYSFVEYAGSNLTHWSFLQKEAHPMEVQRLCGHAMLLVDEDDSATPGTSKAKRVAELRAAIKERLLVTDGREVENMLPARVVRAVIEGYEGKGGAVPAFTRDDYRNRPIGKWIDELLGAAKKRKGSYGDDSGTITDKLGFCERAVDAMRAADFTFADLPAEVQALVARIYAHIEEQNR